MTEAKIDNAIERYATENIARTTDLNKITHRIDQLANDNEQLKTALKQLELYVQQIQKRLLMVAGNGN